MVKQGRKHTEETKLKISITSKERWSDPDYKCRILEARKVRVFRHSEESKLKMSLARKGKPSGNKGCTGYVPTEEVRQKISIATKRRWEEPEYREKMSSINKGRLISDETKLKMSVSRKQVLANHPEYRTIWDTPEWRERQSRVIRQKWEDPEYRARLSAMHVGNLGRTGIPHTDETRKHLSQVFMGRFVSDETRKKMSVATKKVWSDPIRKRDRVYAMRKACCTKPNLSEVKLGKLLDSSFPDEWSFVGAGDLIVGGKNPDFVHVNGCQLIELYGDYWHQGDDPWDRINYFAQYGYYCIVVWEHELKDEEGLLVRLYGL